MKYHSLTIYIISSFLALCLGIGVFCWQYNNSSDFIESPPQKELNRKPAYFVKKTIIGNNQKDFLNNNISKLISKINKMNNTQELEKAFLTLSDNVTSENFETIRDAFISLFGKWGSMDPISAWIALDKLPEGMKLTKNDFQKMIIESWSQKDFDGLKNAYLDTNSVVYKNADVLVKLIIESTKLSHEETWKWIRTLSPREQKLSITHFIPQIIQSENTGQISNIASYFESIQFNKITSGEGLMEITNDPILKTIAMWSNYDFENTLKWIQSQNNILIQKIFLKELLKEKSKKDIFETSKIIFSLTLNNEDAANLNAQSIIKIKEDFLKDISSSLDFYDFETSVRWLDYIEKEWPDVDVSKNLFPIIYNLPAHEADKKLIALPEGKTKDALLFEYIKIFSKKNVESSVNALKYIKDNSLKSKALNFINENQ